MQQILDFINTVKSFNFIKKQQTNLVAIDIGSHAIKAIEIGLNENKLFLENYAIVPLPEGCIEGHQIKNYNSITEELTKFINEDNYHFRDTALVLSGPQVVTQVIKVPAEFADSQLKTHIEIQAQKNLPFDLEELALDFDIMDGGEDNDGYIEVLLAAAKKDYVNEYINVLKAVDLNIKIIDVYNCVLGRLAKYVAAPQLNTDSTDNVCAMVDIGHEVLTLSIFKDDEQLFLKENSFGGKELNKLIRQEHSIDYAQSELLKLRHEDPQIASLIEQFKEQLVNNIFQMLQFFYSSASSNRINCIFLLGGMARLENLDKLIQQRVNIPVEILEPFINIDTSKFNDTENFDTISSELAPACGLALRSYVE